jgi:Sulfatase
MREAIGGEFVNARTPHPAGAAGSTPTLWDATGTDSHASDAAARSSDAAGLLDSIVAYSTHAAEFCNTIEGIADELGYDPYLFPKNKPVERHPVRAQSPSWSRFSPSAWRRLGQLLRQLPKRRNPTSSSSMGDVIGWMQPSIYHEGLAVGETPNIDRIGHEGAKFITYYAEQSCTAGRTAFITGMRPRRHGSAGNSGQPLLSADWHGVRPT